MNCEELHELEGLQFIPVAANKKPTVKNWQNSTDRFDLSNCVAVGLVCGKPSGNLEVIDIDEKYSLDGKLCENYKRLIHEVDKTILPKLVVQKTKNNGFHFIYRCSEIGGNAKLANRPTTDKEREETYRKTYEAEIAKSIEDEVAKKIAEKAKKNDKVRVLIETRGVGGQVVCYPTEGYEIIHGDFYGIQEITVDQRELLYGIASHFNQVFDEVGYVKAQVKHEVRSGISPFEDYDERGDVIGLLENNGWKIVGRKGAKIIFLRPGQTTSQSSGNYDTSKKWFSVFTTSTEFEPQHAYRPYAVFATLECDKDFSVASKKLFELGFGAREKDNKTQSTREIKSRVEVDDNDLSFLAKPEDYSKYLTQVRNGTLPAGLTTGSENIDRYFLFKEGNFVNINGHANAGKSVFIWWLALLSAMYHDWHWIIFSSENTLGGFMRKMIQFYWGKPLGISKYQMSVSEETIARKFIESHFSLIKAEEAMFNYKDIINMVKKASKVKRYEAVLIDPYNSLKIDLSGFSKLSTHEYHYEALSDIKLYGSKNNISFYINHHAVTAALRAKDGEKKYPVAPQSADTESGGKVVNKADDFLTIHRLTQHPTEYMITELHVRKIKDTDTGGMVTPFDNPVKLEMYKGMCAFKDKVEDFSVFPVDPIERWHSINSPKTSEIDFEETKESEVERLAREFDELYQDKDGNYF
jgi:hypothetical protein